MEVNNGTTMSETSFSSLMTSLYEILLGIPFVLILKVRMGIVVK